MEKITIEKPERLTPKNVCYWYSDKGELIGNQKSKALKFIKMGCIKQNGKNWKCEPIKGYNITTYYIENGKCTCQYNAKYDKKCSHILAVNLLNFITNWNESK